MPTQTRCFLLQCMQISPQMMRWQQCSVSNGTINSFTKILSVAQCKIIHDNLQNGTLPLMRHERSEEEREADKIEATERSNRDPSVKPNQTMISQLHM